VDASETKAFYASRGIGRRVGFGSRPALLVVDFSIGFTDPASPLGASCDPEIAATRRLLDAAREAGLPIHHTTVAYAPGGRDGGPFLDKMPALRELLEGSRSAELDPRLGRRPEEPLWTKKGASAFFGTALAAALATAAVDTVIVAGCTTSGCIRASVVDACQHGFRTIVVREAVCDRAPGPHEANLFDMDAKYADVVALDEALAAIARSSGTRRAS
jgi:maleamate amidohydrolase